MAIREKIKEFSLSIAKNEVARDMRIGLRYTSVLLDNGQLGLAYTFPKDSREECSAFKGLRPLAGKEASTLLGLFDSPDNIESAVALATANALCNTTQNGQLVRDTLDYLELQHDDKVGMVGHFAPLVPLLRKKVSSLTIFEQIEHASGDLLPESDAYTVLPQCNVALITSTSILNHTIDPILVAAQSCREVMLLGASTPLIPEVFSSTSVTILSGVVVTRPQEIMRIVSEGGGVRFFRDHVKKVNIRLQ